MPDDLARNVAAPPIKIRPVDDELVLKDDAMELDLYHVKDNSHSDTLLMGWVPRDHILVQADLYDSGWLKYPWADNLKENVALRKLQVEKDVPIHGNIESYADVLKRMAEAEEAAGRGKPGAALISSICCACRTPCRLRTSSHW